jgi:hypothetical protein
MIMMSLKFIISVTDGHCDYLPWVPKDPTLPLFVPVKYVWLICMAFYVLMYRTVLAPWHVVT